MIEPGYQTLLDEFIERWPLEEVRTMTLDDYTDLNNKDTFCQWVETKTKRLGSIKGVNSSKFGIYRTRKKSPPKSTFTIKGGYCWEVKAGKNREEAFLRVRERICTVIEAAQICDLETIDDVPLHPYFKWKIAALYSNGIIPPIFNSQVLESLSKLFSVSFHKRKAASVLEQVMNSVPPSQCRFRYVFKLFKDFYNNPDWTKDERIRNEKKQFRKFKKEGYTAQQRHSEIQKKLLEVLKEMHPNDRIQPEENYIDMVRENTSEYVLYEVKSSPSPLYCIREALGQVLSYAFRCRTKKKLKLVIVGSNQTTTFDENFISFISDKVDMPFEYMSIAIE
mgnify:CR=1 FL=1